jgi:hypothetical protein
MAWWSIGCRQPVHEAMELEAKFWSTHFKEWKLRCVNSTDLACNLVSCRLELLAAAVVIESEEL